MSFSDGFDDDRRPGGGGMNLDLRYWFWVFRRRFWLFAVVAVLLATLGVGVALVLPPTYEARATLLVESQQIPTDLVRSTVSASASEQIEVIKQRLLTRETLLELADKHRVFPGDTRLTLSERVQEMRDAISFSSRILGGGRRDDTVSTAVSIGFRADAGGKAAGVVNDLVTRVLRQSAELRRNRAGTTASYFRQEVDRLGGELSGMENRIVAFQEDNKESLPESLSYRRSQLDLLQERLQRFELERIELQQEAASLEMTLGDDVPDVGEAATRSMQELTELRRTLIRRRAILSDSHPEIQSLRQAIAAQEKAVAAEAEAIRSGELPAPGPAAGAGASTQASAVRELRRRLMLARSRLAYNEDVVAQLETQRDELERSLLETPNIQMEFAALQRAHEAVEARYSVALAKLAEAEAGEQLEDKQQGERLEVIEQATVPEEPVSPNRKAYAVMGVGGGLGAGLGLIVLLEMMSGVVRRPEDLARIGREPAAVIPYIATTGERRVVWGGRILGLLLMIACVSGGLWAVHTYYLPLETVAGKVADKSGLEGALDMIRRRFGG